MQVSLCRCCGARKLHCEQTAGCGSLVWELLLTTVGFVAYEVVTINLFLFCNFGVFLHFALKNNNAKFAVAKPISLAHL